MSSRRNVERISMRNFNFDEKKALDIALRFIARDFVYTDEMAAKHQQELELAGTTEKELWVSRDIKAGQTYSDISADGTIANLKD